MEHPEVEQSAVLASIRAALDDVLARAGRRHQAEKKDALSILMKGFDENRKLKLMKKGGA